MLQRSYLEYRYSDDESISKGKVNIKNPLRIDHWLRDLVFDGAQTEEQEHCVLRGVVIQSNGANQ